MILFFLKRNCFCVFQTGQIYGVLYVGCFMFRLFCLEPVDLSYLWSHWVRQIPQVSRKEVSEKLFY